MIKRIVILWLVLAGIALGRGTPVLTPTETNDATTITYVTTVSNGLTTAYNAAILAATNTVVGRENFLSVVDYGAVSGDGTNDNAAIAATFNATAGSDAYVYFPKGTYDITSRVLCTNNSAYIIKGEGATINVTMTDGLPALYIGQVGSGTNSLYTSISGLRFNMGGTTSGGAFDLVETHGYNVIRDCLFYNFATNDAYGIKAINVGNNQTYSTANTDCGLYITGCGFFNERTAEESSFDYSTTNNAFGIGVKIGSSGNNSEYWKITDSTFLNISRGIVITEGANGIIDSCDFHACEPTYSGTVTNSGVVWVDTGGSSNNGKLTISNCKFNHNKGHGIYVDYVNTSRPTSINNCQFIANTGAPIVFSADFWGNVSGCYFERANTVWGNTPWTNTQHYIELYNADYTMIFGNQFQNDSTTTNTVYGVFANTTADNFAVINNMTNAINMCNFTNAQNGCSIVNF